MQHMVGCLQTRSVLIRSISSSNTDGVEHGCAAKTADMGVAHRAFLVPPHKKRGKGGRQPAADPRLDPNIDARRAKRILANRLSAARSKLRQKNQMDVRTAPAALPEPSFSKGLFSG